MGSLIYIQIEWRNGHLIPIQKKCLFNTDFVRVGKRLIRRNNAGLAFLVLNVNDRATRVIKDSQPFIHGELGEESHQVSGQFRFDRFLCGFLIRRVKERLHVMETRKKSQIRKDIFQIVREGMVLKIERAKFILRNHLLSATHLGAVDECRRDQNE